MDEKKLLTAKDVFCRIKQFYYGSGDRREALATADVGRSADYIAALRELEGLFSPEERAEEAPRLLLSCAEKIRAALADSNFRLAGDLADAAVRLCGVFDFPFFSRRRFYETVALPLEDKHGLALFEDEGEEFLSGKDSKARLRPVFSSKKRYMRYSDGDADGDFQLAHPWLYRLFTVLGLLVFALPIVLFALLSSAFGGGAWVILGYFGAAALGMGLDSLLFSFIRQYMGHTLTLLLCIGGVALMGLSLLLL